MPAAGPYRSHLLNVLRRSSQQLVQQCRQQVRQIQVQAIWGVQAALYPLYRLFHRHSRPPGQGLAGHADQERQPRQLWVSNDDLVSQKLPPVDQPIQKLLRAIKVTTGKVRTLPKALGPAVVSETCSELPEITIKPLAPQRGWKKWQHHLQELWQEWQPVFVWPKAMQRLMPPAQFAHRALPSAPSPLLIQGVAVELQTQELVLVGNDNQVLNLLSPSQQHQLQRHLTWELTEYWRQVRQVARILHQPRLLLATETVQGFIRPTFPSFQLPQPPVAILGCPEPSAPNPNWPGEPQPFWRQWQRRLFDLTAQLAQNALLVIHPRPAHPKPIQLERTNTQPANQASELAFELAPEVLQELPKSTSKRLQLPRSLFPQLQMQDFLGVGAGTREQEDAPATSNSLAAAPALSWVIPLPQPLKRHLGRRLAQVQPKENQGLIVTGSHSVESPADYITMGSTGAAALVVSPVGNVAKAPASSLIRAEKSGLAVSRDGLALDTQTVVVGYETHALERILAVLDQVMVWVERLGMWLWRVWLSAWRQWFRG